MITDYFYNISKTIKLIPLSISVVNLDIRINHGI